MKVEFIAHNGRSNLKLDAQTWDEAESELYEFANSGKWVIQRLQYVIESSEDRIWSSDWNGKYGPKGWVK